MSSSIIDLTADDSVLRINELESDSEVICTGVRNNTQEGQ